ncbi:MAG: Arc family DNA-binding protein [Bacteroidetes bacterium]|nr:Arc family DNA-binding protein [Bacteroidota bacterium]
MSKKKAFVLRVDEDMLKDIEKWAADEFRSTNGQIEWMLREMLKKHGKLRSKTKSSGDESETE